MPKKEKILECIKSKKMNAPAKIPTTPRRIKIICFIIAIIAVICLVFAAIWCFVLPHDSQTDNNATSAFESLVQPIEQQTQDPTENGTAITQEESRNNIDQAKTAISDYYRLLSQNDSSGLANAGFSQASSAISMGWLEQIQYRVDADVQPDVSSLPQSVTMYGGNYVYKISDFFTNAPSNKVHSIITGDTGYEGWIYYNRQTNRWIIVDPTMPTAVSSPESNTVTRASSDGQITTKMTSNGALSNSWWAVADINVEITSSASEYSVTVAQRYIDDGVTVSVPGTLTQGIQNTSIAANNENNQTTITGTCRVTRGVTSGFGLERIGATALMLDGNIAPVDIQTPNENATPLYAMGAARVSDIAQEAIQQQIDEYDATGEVAPLESDQEQANN